jgi:hypothetical protein
VLAAGSLAVVPVADEAPSDTGVAVGFRDFWDWSDGVGKEIKSFAAESLGAEDAFGAGQEVVGDVFEVTAVFVPGAGGGDVVGCAFAWGLLLVRLLFTRTLGAIWLTSDLDQNRKVFSSSLTPRLEGLEKLKAVTIWRDLYIDVMTILWRRLV